MQFSFRDFPKLPTFLLKIVNEILSIIVDSLTGTILDSILFPVSIVGTLTLIRFTVDGIKLG